MIASFAFQSGNTIQVIIEGFSEEEFTQYLNDSEGKGFFVAQVPSMVTDTLTTCLIRLDDLSAVMYPLHEDNFWEGIKEQRRQYKEQRDQYYEHLEAQNRPAPGLHL